MRDYSGHFMTGLAGGLQTGLQFSLERNRLRLIEKEEKRKQQAEQKIADTINAFLNDPAIQAEMMKYGGYSEAMIPYIVHTIEDVRNIMDNIAEAKRNLKTAELTHQTNLLVEKAETIAEYQKLGIVPTYDEQGNMIFAEQDQQYLQQRDLIELATGDVKGEMTRQAWEGRGFGALPVPLSGESGNIITNIRNLGLDPEHESSLINSYLKKITGQTETLGFDSPEEAMATRVSIAGFREEPYMLDNGKWEVRYEFMEPEAAPGQGAAGAAGEVGIVYYKTFEEVLLNEPQKEGHILRPVYQVGRGWRPDYEPIPPGVTPEDERTYRMATGILFGETDVLQGIVRFGIITPQMQQALEVRPLTNQEKTEVVNNWLNIKPSIDHLSPEVSPIVEAFLLNIGISMDVDYTQIAQEQPAPQVAPQGLVRRGLNYLANLFGIGRPATPAVPQETPLATPTPQGTPGPEERLRERLGF